MLSITKLSENQLLHYLFVAISLCLVAVGLLLMAHLKQARDIANQTQAELVNQLGIRAVDLIRSNITQGQPTSSTIQQLSNRAIAGACLYMNSQLRDSFSRNALSCSDHWDINFSPALQQLTKKTLFSFEVNEGKRGLLVVFHSPVTTNFATPLAVLITLLGALGILIWLATRLYFTTLKKRLGLSSLGRLQTVCEDIVHHQNYKQKIPTNMPYPFDFILQAFKAMLDDLLKNETQIQEYAVLVQEKEDQLKSQKKLLADRHQNLQKMFAGASHDLKQPLQAMAIFISAIRDSASDSQLPHINKLDQVLDNLNALFSDLLDISKIESRMQRIPKSTIHVRPLLQKIFDEFEALSNEKGIALRLHPKDATVISNPNMLERIIRNMISNAIRYTRTGGVLIGCRVRKDHVSIEVWDTGRGIPPNKMNEIFNEFVQIKEDQQESDKGVGLGLFIVKKLAQLLDHKIVVKSKLRKGTMFRVEIPKQLPYINLPPSSETPAQTISDPLTPPTQDVKPHNTHVLLLDDDHLVRESIKVLLQQWQFKVSDFEDIEGAKNFVKHQDSAIDLVISDFQLAPDQTGLHALAELSNELNTSPPAIIITGTQDQNLLQSIKNSKIPFLSKPVKPAKLRALINVLLSQ